MHVDRPGVDARAVGPRWDRLVLGERREPRIEVEAARPGRQNTKVKVTEAEVVYVQVDERGRPIPLEAPQS